MDRRGFIRGVTQAGIAVPGLMMDAGPSTAAAADGQVASPIPHGESSSADENLQVANTVTLLDGTWLLVTDPDNVGRGQAWYMRPSAEAKPGRVPGIYQEVFPAYHGVVWYWREFTPPAHLYSQGRYLLSFGAVAYLTEVWVNGVAIGGHEGSETPFVLDATDAIKPQASNLLAVRVLKPGDTPIDGYVLKEIPHRNETLTGYTPGNSYDYGGIVESVELLLTPAVRVENLYVRPDWKTGNIRLQANVRNTTSSSTRAHLQISVAPSATGKTLLITHLERDVPPGDTLLETQLHVEGHRLWDLDDPYLYRLTVRATAGGVEGFDETSVRLGFRDFRVEKGYFRLNGKRIFLRSTHTGNHCPISQTLPPPGAPDFPRLDMLYAKASGFNTVRFISGVAHPYQLDLCDEIGLMVYEESLAGWMLADSPKMKERLDFSVREMVLRDRNHPCIAMFGMLNETYDTPIFHAAVAALPIARQADPDRLMLLSSGRWDGVLSIGSASNPGSSEWEFVWGNEGPGAPSVGAVHNAHDWWWKTGDVHHYPKVPQDQQQDQQLRTVGQDASKPIFQSEYGIGSMMDVIHEARMYEQLGVRPDVDDYVIVKSMADRFTADWKRFGMEGVCAFPEFLLRDSQFRSARHRLLGFNVLRSNPKNCGFNLTGMLDHALTGEGVWRFWRDWKPGVMDAMKDGWCPLRWCLFVYPTHNYIGRPVKLEAVLANEDVLRPDEYPVCFRICGPAGIAWERSATVRIDTPPPGEDGPLAIPVMAEEVSLSGPEGDYELAVSIEQGAAATEALWQFHLTDPASLPHLNQTVTLWGVPPDVANWLKAHGVTGEEFRGTAPGRREIILVGDLSKTAGTPEDWKELARRMARGSVVVFLSQQAFQREKDAVAWLPLAQKGRCYRFNDWLYHKECVAKVHPVFEGLQGGGILDWYYYGPVIPHYLFDGQDLPAEVIAAAFAAGYPIKGGYASGILLGRYGFGEGHFILNTFPILDQLDHHPAADRLLLNLVKHAGSFAEKPLAGLPADFDVRLRAIGYSK
jgi:hypothetical protein